MSDIERRGTGRTTDHEKVMSKVAARNAELDAAEVETHEDLLVNVYVGADRRLHRDAQDPMVAIAAVLVGPENTPVSPELVKLVLKALNLGDSLQQFLEAFKANGGKAEQVLNLLAVVFGVDEVGELLARRFGRTTTRSTARTNYKVVGHPRWTEAYDGSDRYRTLTEQGYVVTTYGGDLALVAPGFDPSSDSPAPRDRGDRGDRPVRSGSPRAPRLGDSSSSDRGDRGERPGPRREDRSRDDRSPGGSPELGALVASAPARPAPDPGTADLPVFRTDDAAPTSGAGSDTGSWRDKFKARPGA